MKIFLTGATGFIGSHVLLKAQDMGVDIVAHRYGGTQPKFPLRCQPVWVETPMDKLSEKELLGCDAVLHLASVGVSPQVATWEEMFYWNVTAAVRFFCKAHEVGVKRFVVTGSYAEYGFSAYRYEKIPADAPLEPTYGYAASKAAFCSAARAFAVEKNVYLDYFRLFSVFGEGQHPSNFWPALKQAALSGEDFKMTLGEQIRDFISVEKVAEKLLVGALHSNGKPGKPYIANLASGHPVALAVFARECWKQWNPKGRLLIGSLPYRQNEVMKYIPAMDS